MLKEFREFAVKGNVMDMAIGIIIGAAFGTIIKSLVADIIMPVVGLLLGKDTIDTAGIDEGERILVEVIDLDRAEARDVILQQ